jgi:hypothetical protein
MTYLVAVSLDSLRVTMGVQGVTHGEDPDFTDRVIKGLIDSNQLRIIHTDDPERVERVAAAIAPAAFMDSPPGSLDRMHLSRDGWRDRARRAIDAVFDA